MKGSKYYWIATAHKAVVFFINESLSIVNLKGRFERSCLNTV